MRFSATARAPPGRGFDFGEKSWGLHVAQLSKPFRYTILNWDRRQIVTATAPTAHWPRLTTARDNRLYRAHWDWLQLAERVAQRKRRNRELPLTTCHWHRVWLRLALAPERKGRIASHD